MRLRSAAARSGPATAAAPAARPIRFACATHVLDNGLTVVLSEDHSVPLVAVQVMVRTGSKHAPAGKSCLPHLVEHLFFQGSAHVPRAAHFRLIHETGGSANASTWFDCTNFYEVVPASQLDLALWLEADRMGFLASGLTQRSFDNQREVMRHEWRQNHRNQPYGVAIETLLRTAFAAGHPYANPPAGRVEELDRVSLDDVADFWERHYGPSNAVLVLCGDLDATDALARVRHYFGHLDPRQAPTRPAAPPDRAAGERRATIADRVHAPRLYVLHEAPSFREPEYEAADALTVLLSQGRSARLQRELVVERRVASDVASFVWPTVEVGLLFVVVTGLPGASIEDLEAALDDSCGALVHDGVQPAELERSLTWGRLALISQLNRVAGRADAFAHATTLRGDAGYVNEAFARYAAVTAPDLERVAQRVLRPGRRTMLRVVPETTQPRRVPAGVQAPGGGRWATPESPAVASTSTGAPEAAGAGAPEPGRRRPPPTGADRPLRLPPVFRRELPNGLRIQVAPRRGLPEVVLCLVFEAGSAAEPVEQSGLADLTARLLTQGAGDRDAIELAQWSDRLGLVMPVGVDHDVAHLALHCLSEVFEDAVELLATVVQRPRFEPAAVQRTVAERMAVLLGRQRQPGAVADETLLATLYGEHPYGRPSAGSPAAIGRLQPAAASDFHRAHCGARHAVLAVCGDVDPVAALETLERRFAGWHGGEGRRAIAVAPSDGAGGPRVVLVDRPGSPQTEIRIGAVTTPYRSADTLPLLVADAILGGSFSSRINLKLREEKGWSYGARTRLRMRRAAAPWLLQAAVEPRLATAAVAELLAEIRGLRERPPGAEEMRLARQSLACSLYSKFETNGQIARQMGTAVAYDLPDGYWESYARDVASVTRDQVLVVAERYLAEHRLAIVAVGDAGAVEGDLERFGPVEILSTRP